MAAEVSEGEHLWFLDTRVSIRASSKAGADRISVLEHFAPYGDSPPLHVHRNEDEIFYLLDGEVAFRLSDHELRGHAGDTIFTSKAVPHTYRVLSKQGARWLTITAGEDFERFVRTVGRPAEAEGLPAPSGPPSVEQMQELAAAASQHGIDLVGPPMS